MHLVKSYIIDIWELCKLKQYGSGTGPLQHRSRPRRDTVCQGKGKLGGGKSCSVVYGSAWSSGHKAHGPSARAIYHLSISIIVIQFFIIGGGPEMFYIQNEMAST